MQAGGTRLSVQQRRYVGSRITRFREHRGLSLEELGQRVGLSAGVLEAVESGRRGVTFECLIDIANELPWPETKYGDTTKPRAHQVN